MVVANAVPFGQCFLCASILGAWRPGFHLFDSVNRGDLDLDLRCACCDWIGIIEVAGLAVEANDPLIQ